MAIGPQSIVYSQSFGEDAEINVDAALKDQNTVYKLVFNHWLLQIVLLVYLAFWIGSSVRRLLHPSTTSLADTVCAGVASDEAKDDGRTSRRMG